MIARRFGALGWVAGIATAATGLYLVSLQVATERAKLEAVEQRIAATQRDMRQLQTELGTRASLRQLEKWNGETLSLTTPKASQFVHDEAQLATLDLRLMPPAAIPSGDAERPAVANIARASYVRAEELARADDLVEATPTDVVAGVQGAADRKRR